MSLLLSSFYIVISVGGLVHPNAKLEDLKELSTLLQLPLVAGTVNRGSSSIGGGMVVNDWTAFCGYPTTSTELALIENIFCINEDKGPHNFQQTMRQALIDKLV